MDPVTRKVHVRVPATSANLGSGFDTAGIALNYHDELEFTLSSDPMNMAAQVIIEGEGADTLPRDESHLVVATFRNACAHFGLNKTGFILEARNNIPQARGMGSSAEAIVAGIAAAYAFSHEGELNRDEIFQLAAQIEGHPDNVAPAVYGGMTVSWGVAGVASDAGVSGVAGSDSVAGDGDESGNLPVFHSVNYLVRPDIHASVFIPDFELSTSKARQALPAAVPFRDAIFNVSRAALLAGAMNPTILASVSDPNQLLLEATDDRLHQPYRGGLMEPSAQLIAKLRKAGFAAAVSGAGPCVLVLHAGAGNDAVDAVAASELESGHWRVLHLDIDAQGVQVGRV